MIRPLRRTGETKEDIRRLKCKVIALAENIMPRLTGHINYLKKRWENIDKRLAERRSRKIREEKELIQIAIHQDNERRVLEAEKGYSKGFVSQARLKPLKIGHPDPEKKLEKIRDQNSEYYIKIDPLEELCKLLTPEEIDLIAEDPKFYFPENKNKEFKIRSFEEFLDVDRWNEIADKVNGRSGDWFTANLEKSVSVKQLKQASPPRNQNQDSSSHTNYMNNVNSTRVESMPKLARFFDHEAFVSDRKQSKSRYVGNKLNAEFERASKVYGEARAKQREEMDQWRKHLENKLESGERAKKEKYRSGIELREEKIRRHNERKKLLNEHFEKKQYQESMLVLNEQIKDICRMIQVDNKMKQVANQINTIHQTQGK